MYKFNMRKNNLFVFTYVVGWAWKKCEFPYAHVRDTSFHFLI